MNLTDYLHDKFLYNGEIASGAYLARLIQDFESDNDVEHTDAEVIRAVRSAGESFVDSMQDNENEPRMPEITEEERAERLAHWEAMRPSVARRRQLTSLLTSSL